MCRRAEHADARVALIVCAALAAALAGCGSRWEEARTGALVRLEAVRAAHSIDGLQAAVLVGGEVVWEVGLGVPADRPMRLGSVTKLVTAMVLVRLVERGALDLDAPIQDYVAFPEQPWVITLRKLAGHLGGIRHYRWDDAARARGAASVTESVSLFASDLMVRQLVKPIGEYAYSSPGYALIGAAIEKVTGLPFIDVVRAEVNLPMGLAFEADAEPGSAWRWASGALVGTARELVRFAWAHSSRPDAAATMFTSQRDRHGAETGVGLGWRIGHEVGPDGARRYVHHAGSMPGCRAVLVYWPDDGVAVAVLSNKTGEPAAIEDLARELAHPFLAAAR